MIIVIMMYESCKATYRYLWSITFPYLRKQICHEQRLQCMAKPLSYLNCLQVLQHKIPNLGGAVHEKKLKTSRAYDWRVPGCLTKKNYLQMVCELTTSTINHLFYKDNTNKIILLKMIKAIIPQ